MGIFSKRLKPLIIGVCGRSCSGKSTVIKGLEEKYKGEFLHINQDKFFKTKADNWERPDALRFDKLIEAYPALVGIEEFTPAKFCEKFQYFLCQFDDVETFISTAFKSVPSGL